MRPTGPLLWKEAAQLLPLAVVLSLSVAAAWVVDEAIGETWFRAESTLTTALGILAPFAFAIGAAAVLVTQEFELGTLTWLRTQPIGWVRLLSVKLAVSLLGLVIVWAVALLFWGMNTRDPIPATVWAPYLALNSLQVMLWTFLAALLGRSSLAALFLVIPAALASLALSGLMAIFLEGPAAFARMGSTDRILLLIPLGLLCLLLTAGVYALASRRLTGSGRLWEQGVSASTSSAPALDFYHPPTEPPQALNPSPLGALLWQHVMSWPGVRAMLLVGVLLVLALILASVQERPGPLAWRFPLGVFAAILVAGAAGASAMAPDNERGRRRFLADHGISPAAVWGTRLVLPVLILLPLGIAAILLGTTARSGEPFGAMGLVGLLSAFAAGLLAGQFATRPVVGVLLGAFLGLPAAGIAGFFLTAYPAGWWAYAPALVIVLGLSLRFARRWLDGRRGWGFWARFGGWLAAAVAVSLGLIATPRLDDLPSADVSELAAEAEAEQQQAHRLVALKRASADPADSDAWTRALRQGPLGEDFEHLWDVTASLLSHGRGPLRGQMPVRGGAAAAPHGGEEDFLQAHQAQLDEIAAKLTHRSDPVQISPASLLALRLGVEGALQAGDEERAVLYLTALLRGVGSEFPLNALHPRKLILDLQLLRELESWVFRDAISPATRETVRRVLRNLPSSRAGARRQLLLDWLWNTELLEGGHPPSVHPVTSSSSAALRIAAFPWERLRSRRWLDAATLRELEILAQSPEVPAPTRHERVVLWRNAEGMGGPGAEPFDESVYPNPSQTVDLAIETDQQRAQLLERLESQASAGATES